MDFGRVGNHDIAVCPYCDLLFDVVGESSALAIETHRRWFDKHIAASALCWAAKEAKAIEIAEASEELQQAFDNDARREKVLADHPDNGKSGYWLVTGTRHDARCKASSAQEAVDKCKEVVGDWESPDVKFLGEELPEVF